MKVYVDTNILVTASVQDALRPSFRAGDTLRTLQDGIEHLRSSRVGGVVFEALHLHCAQKAACDRIYTFNVKDFRALAPNKEKTSKKR